MNTDTDTRRRPLPTPRPTSAWTATSTASRSPGSKPTSAPGPAGSPRPRARGCSPSPPSTAGRAGPGSAIAPARTGSPGAAGSTSAPATTTSASPTPWNACPLLREAFAAGRISYSKARAVSRVAEPDTDAEWVRQALRHTADELDRLAAAHARLHPADERDADRRHERRRLSWRWDHDGMLVAQVVLSPEDGALFVKAVDAARASLDDTSPAPDVPDPAPSRWRRRRRRSAEDADDDGQGAAEADAKGPTPAAPARERTLDADALVAVAAGFLASGAPALSDPTRHTVTVHIHADALAAAYAGTARPTPSTATDRHRRATPTRRTPARPATTDSTGRRRPRRGAADRHGAEQTDAEQTRRSRRRPRRARPRRPPRPGRRRPRRPRRRRRAHARRRRRPRSTAAPPPRAPECAGPQTFPAGPLAGLRCDVEPGIGLHPETVRRIACDAWLRALVVDRDGNPLDLGRRRRLATGRVRDAVYARDRGTCRYPGCERTRWLDVHHLDHWADHHGRTEPPNLVVICGFHHRAVHEGGTALRMDARGAVTAHLPDGGSCTRRRRSTPAPRPWPASPARPRASMPAPGPAGSAGPAAPCTRPAPRTPSSAGAAPARRPHAARPSHEHGRAGCGGLGPQPTRSARRVTLACLR